MHDVVGDVVHFITGAGEDECPGVDFVANFAGEEQEWELGCFVEGWWEREVWEACCEVGG